MNIPQRKELRLVHRGRKSGKEFSTTVWFVELDGELWIGSRDSRRNWVRNLRAAGAAKVDFGEGPFECACEWIEDAGLVDRFQKAIQAKYPIMSRVVGLLQRGGTRVACRLSPV